MASGARNADIERNIGNARREASGKKGPATAIADGGNSGTLIALTVKRFLALIFILISGPLVAGQDKHIQGTLRGLVG
jgi:hypothetical protein